MLKSAKCKNTLRLLASWCRPRGVTVSTLNAESSDRGSNPREAFQDAWKEVCNHTVLLNGSSLTRYLAHDWHLKAKELRKNIAKTMQAVKRFREDDAVVAKKMLETMMLTGSHSSQNPQMTR